MTRPLIALLCGLGLAILAVAAFLAFRAPSQETAGFALLTAEEMAQRDDTQVDESDEHSTTRAMSVTQNKGPIINVSAPSGYALVSPVDFDISLSPRNGQAVDMSTLRIEYRLGPAWVNLTQRVMKQASISG